MWLFKFKLLKLKISFSVTLVIFQVLKSHVPLRSTRYTAEGRKHLHPHRKPIGQHCPKVYIYILSHISRMKHGILIPFLTADVQSAPSAFSLNFYEAINVRVILKIKYEYAQCSYNNHATLSSQENSMQN